MISFGKKVAALRKELYSSDLELEEFLVERIGLVQGAKHSHSSGYGAYLQRGKRPILSLENL